MGEHGIRELLMGETGVILVTVVLVIVTALTGWATWKLAAATFLAVQAEEHHHEERQEDQRLRQHEIDVMQNMVDHLSAIQPNIITGELHEN